MYSDEEPECNLIIKLKGGTCKEHYGHTDFQTAFWVLTVVAIIAVTATYYATGLLEERAIMTEKINAMSCQDLTKLLAESQSKSSLYRAEQNYKWECMENKILELES